MAESLARPWIVNHLVEIAEKRGANIHDAPPLKQRRKVQITKFITFPPNNRPNDIVWALVSDKQYEIIVKITAPAVTAYNKENDVFGLDEDERRLTTRRFALATINDVKAFFARVPLGNGKGMSDTETIVLEVGDIRILGADHEGIFGNPTGIESHEDIQHWISGLRKGGGGGNVLMRPREETIVKDSELPLEKNVASERPIVDSMSKSGAASSQRGVKQVDVLRKWKRKWKTLHIRQFPPEVQPMLDQILIFGQEVSHCEQNANAEIFPKNAAKDTASDCEGERTDEPNPQTSKSSGSQHASLRAKDNSLRTPLSPLTLEPEPSTPTVWEDSEPETPVKVKSYEPLPTPRRTRNKGSQHNPDRAGESLQRQKNDATYLTEPSEGEQASDDGNGEDSLSEDENADESSFPVPTPAQRQKNSNGTMPRTTQGDQGATPNQSDIPPSAHSKVDSSQVLPRSQPSQRTSQPSRSQSMADMPAQDPHRGAPRVLVPDSDTSVHVTSQPQSQSQSQPQSLSKFYSGQSQFDLQSHPQPLRDSTNNSAQPSQVRAPANSGKHLLLSSQCCDDGSPQSSGIQTNKRRVAKKTSLQAFPSSNSITTSHSGFQSKPTGAPVSQDSALATFGESVDLTAPYPSLAQRAQETKDCQQSSSTTQDDSQASRTEDSSLGQVKATKPLDVDDARTHRRLSGELSERNKHLKILDLDGSSRSMREVYRLSHVQGSPTTTHLGKRGRPSISSPPPLDGVGAGIVGRVHLQKKLRKASGTDDVHHTATSAAHEATHDSQVWIAPTFLRQRETYDTRYASVPGENVGCHPRISGPSEKKMEQRDRVLLDEQDSTNSRIMQSAGGDINHPDSSQATTSQSSSKAGTAKKTGFIPTNPSRVNVKDGPEDRGLLDGFTSDLTLHRTPGGRRWLNWDDSLRILSRLYRRDFRE